MAFSRSPLPVSCVLLLLLLLLHSKFSPTFLAQSPPAFQNIMLNKRERERRRERARLRNHVFNLFEPGCQMVRVFGVPDEHSGNARVDKFQQLSSSCSDLVASELRVAGRASSASAEDGPSGNTGDLTLLIFAVVVVASRVLPLLPSITANCWHTTSFQQSLKTLVRRK